MIHYQLQCQQGHDFDGWFRDSAAFDAQAARGLVSCPFCGDTAVTRALMTPAVAKGREDKAPPAKPPAPPRQVSVTGDAVPDHLRAMLQQLRAEVERNCEYVGATFADEARRIHSGESERRAIYGEATSEQAQSLADDGIEVARIPWVPRADG